MALCTIDNLKEYLGAQENSADDALLERLVDAASSVIEAYCSRVFTATTYTELLDGTGTDVLGLRHYPILSVSALLEAGAAISTGSDPYAANAPSALIYAEEGQLVRPYLRWLPYRRYYSVTYQAGYSPIPASIVQACVELAGLMTKQKEHVGLQTKTTSVQTTTYISQLSEGSQRALDLYRDTTIGRPM